MTDEMHYTNSNAGQWVKAMTDIEKENPTHFPVPGLSYSGNTRVLALPIGGQPLQVAESTMDDIDRLFFDLRKLKQDYAEACADRDRARLAEARVGEIAGEIERKIAELQQAVKGITP